MEFLVLGRGDFPLQYKHSTGIGRGVLGWQVVSQCCCHTRVHPITGTEPVLQGSAAVLLALRLWVALIVTVCGSLLSASLAHPPMAGSTQQPPAHNSSATDVGHGVSQGGALHPGALIPIYSMGRDGTHHSLPSCRAPGCDPNRAAALPASPVCVCCPCHHCVRSHNGLAHNQSLC